MSWAVQQLPPLSWWSRIGGLAAEGTQPVSLNCLAKTSLLQASPTAAKSSSGRRGLGGWCCCEQREIPHLKFQVLRRGAVVGSTIPSAQPEIRTLEAAWDLGGMD